MDAFDYAEDQDRFLKSKNKYAVMTIHLVNPIAYNKSEHTITFDMRNWKVVMVTDINCFAVTSVMPDKDETPSETILIPISNIRSVVTVVKDINKDFLM